MAAGERHERVVLVPEGQLLVPGDRVQLRAVGETAGGWFKVLTVGLSAYDPPDPFHATWKKAGLRPLWCGLERE